MSHATSSTSPPTDLFDRAAQLLFVRIGSNMNPPIVADDEVDRITAIIERCPIGGLLLFNGVFGQTRQTIDGLQRVSRFPLLVAADMERGAGQQLRGATVFPHAMALAANENEGVRAAREMGRITATEALSEAIPYVLGPVADVNRNPKNPIIGTRSFGRNPQVVAALVRAYVEGCRSAGAIVAPKHFPGHGNTAADSHSEIPEIEGSLSDFEVSDLMPFSAAIDAGADTVMTAHARYPDLDPSGKVATGSSVILGDLLRSHLHFGGAVVTDSLLMAGVRQNYSGTGEMVVDLVRAGQDLLLDVDDAEAAAHAIVDAVVKGTLTQETVDRAVERAWALKVRLRQMHGSRWHLEPPAPPSETVLAAHREIADRIARQGIAHRFLDSPRPHHRAPFVVMVKPYRTHLDPEIEPLGRLVSQTLGPEAYHQIGDDTDDDELADLAKLCEGVDELVVAAAVRPAAWRTFGLSDRLAKFVDKLLGAAEHPILVVLGSPDALGGLTYKGPGLYTFSDVEASQRAAFDFIMTEKTLAS